MSKNKNLLGMADVCEYYGVSEGTIRRRMRDSRDGLGTFPLPLFPKGCRLLWRKCDIENWAGDNSEVINLTTTTSMNQLKTPMSPVQKQSSNKARMQLESDFGIKVPK